jgi:hypothetical protein
VYIEAQSRQARGRSFDFNFFITWILLKTLYSRASTLLSLLLDKLLMERRNSDGFY